MGIPATPGGILTRPTFAWGWELAYLVCTKELLNTRAHTVTEMRLTATLNGIVEYAERQKGRTR